MYTLRILTETKDGNGRKTSRTENFDLGSNYSVYDKFSEEVNEVLENSTDKAKEDFRLMVRGEKGPIFIIKKMDQDDGTRCRYYIVSDNGQTFESLNRE